MRLFVWSFVLTYGKVLLSARSGCLSRWGVIMTTTVEFDKTVTKNQIAGILRKANVVRYKRTTGGKSVLRDIRNNHSYYSGIEVIEQATSYNVNPSNLRPKYVKSTTGKFIVQFVHGYSGEKFTQEQASTILKQAIDALVSEGFMIVSDKYGYIVAKVGA